MTAIFSTIKFAQNFVVVTIPTKEMFGRKSSLPPNWSKNRTGENRTGEPRPSTRGPFRGHLRGMFRGESLKG